MRCGRCVWLDARPHVNACMHAPIMAGRGIGLALRARMPSHDTGSLPHVCMSGGPLACWSPSTCSVHTLRPARSPVLQRSLAALAAGCACFTCLANLRPRTHSASPPPVCCRSEHSHDGLTASTSPCMHACGHAPGRQLPCQCSGVQVQLWVRLRAQLEHRCTGMTCHVQPTQLMLHVAFMAPGRGCDS